MSSSVLTIGHSTHSAEVLIRLLRLHEADAVADVRSSPYSRLNPQFNRETLVRTLKAAGIKYVFLGRELGARSEDPAHYVHGKVQYGLLSQSAPFRDGIGRIINGSSKYRVALLCAEKDPLDCHRTILISRELDAKGLDVAHILANGALESHAEAIRRLLERLRMPSSDLFRTYDDLIREAYAKQGDAIAYVRSDMDMAIPAGMSRSKSA